MNPDTVDPASDTPTSTRSSSNASVRPFDPITIGSIHDALSCPRRRVVVHLLQEADRPLSMDELAARAEALDVPPSVVKRHRPDQPIRDWLYHEHVLELDAAGIVVYDPETDRVTLPEAVTFSVQLPE